MKKIKIICLVTAMLFVLLAASGCKSTPTFSATRYGAETLVYNVSLFDTDATTISEKSYTHDYDLYSNVPTYDPVKPLSVSGTKTVQIETNVSYGDVSDAFKVTSTTSVVEVYSQDAVTDSRLDAARVENTNDSLKTEIVSVIIFDSNCSPLYGKRDVQSCYVGALNSQAYSYLLEVTYKNKSAEVKYTDRLTSEERTATADLSKTSFYLDSEQLLIYVRSLDQTTNGFGSSVAVTVFDALGFVTGASSAQTSTLTVSLTRNTDRIVFDNTTDTWRLAKVNEMYFYTGNFVTYLYNTCNDANSITIGTTSARQKFSTIKCQQGYWTYSLDMTQTDADTTMIYDSLFNSAE